MSRQTIYYPPPGRPGWASLGTGQMELLYLAWGWRRYGKTPQMASRREGWLYFTVRKGSPTLELPGSSRQRVKMAACELVILDQDCLCGWSDLPAGVAEICTWVWRSPSRWTELRPEPGQMLKLKLPEEIHRRVCALHGLARAEIQSSDETTGAALEALRLQVDLELVRSRKSRRPATDAQRIELASRWIEEHLADHHPVTGLSDYLQISPASLNRLFQRSLRTSVRELATRRRVERARLLIETEGWSVKETAYHLGYRFPNDLSRVLNRR